MPQVASSSAHSPGPVSPIRQTTKVTAAGVAHANRHCHASRRCRRSPAFSIADFGSSMVGSAAGAGIGVSGAPGRRGSGMWTSPWGVITGSERTPQLLEAGFTGAGTNDLLPGRMPYSVSWATCDPVAIAIQCVAVAPAGDLQGWESPLAQPGALVGHAGGESPRYTSVPDAGSRI